MGNSHFKSNFIGFAGTEYIASVAAVKNVTLIEGTTGNFTTASANVIKASGLGDSVICKLVLISVSLLVIPTQKLPLLRKLRRLLLPQLRVPCI